MSRLTASAAKSRVPAPRKKPTHSKLAFRPLTAETWPDLETLFGPRGACGGCWCMAWRLTPSAFKQGKGDGNRRALRTLANREEPTGILAYDGGEAIAWCAVAPRESTPRLAGSRVLAPIDDLPVWSVTCFFVRRSHRKLGVTVALLRAAAAHARRMGARVLEGYPNEPREGELPAAFVWTGLASAFRDAGFAEVARRSATRPIFRLQLRKGAARGRAAKPSPAAAATGSSSERKGSVALAATGSTIEQERIFPASPPDLFRAFADPKLHAAFTGAAATGRARPGVRFTAWDGYITGKTLEVEPARRIVQEWRTTEWPEGAPASRLELTFHEHARGTRLVLRQTRVPRSQAKSYRQGWDEFYWRPLRKWLSARPD